MTLLETLAQAKRLGLDAIDAELLLLHALGRPHDRAWLRAHDTDALPEPVRIAFGALAQRRLAGEPVAYLVGDKEFFGLKLQVDARVLVPRPDTETLVEWALDLWGAQPIRAIDLGTGSGAIALALKHARPRWQVSAIDASAAALAVARANAQRLGLNIDFATGHWLSGVSGTFELIVSNPPYIAEGDAHLAALQHEPLSALVAGRDGLDDIRQIINQAPTHLVPGGWLVLEHGHDQSEAVAELLRAAGFLEVQNRCDLAGIARCTGGRRPSTLPGDGPAQRRAAPEQR